MFSVFQFSSQVQVLILIFASFQFYSIGQQSLQFCKFPFFIDYYKIIIRSCFVLLLEEIQFLSKNLPFLATSKFSRVICCL